LAPGHHGESETLDGDVGALQSQEDTVKPSTKSPLAAENAVGKSCTKKLSTNAELDDLSMQSQKWALRTRCRWSWGRSNHLPGQAVGQHFLHYFRFDKLLRLSSPIGSTKDFFLQIKYWIEIQLFWAQLIIHQLGVSPYFWLTLCFCLSVCLSLCLSVPLGPSLSFPTHQSRSKMAVLPCTNRFGRLFSLWLMLKFWHAPHPPLAPTRRRCTPRPDWGWWLSLSLSLSPCACQALSITMGYYFTSASFTLWVGHFSFKTLEAKVWNTYTLGRKREGGRERERVHSTQETHILLTHKSGARETTLRTQQVIPIFRQNQQSWSTFSPNIYKQTVFLPQKNPRNVRSNRPIETSDRIVRSNCPIETSDRIVRSKHPIKTSDRIVRSNRRLSHSSRAGEKTHLSEVAIFWRIPKWSTTGLPDGIFSDQKSQFG
jgi:hypothetical protein